MEVCCEPATFVKATSSHSTLHLTRLDQIRNYYCPCLLFYPVGKHSSSVARDHVEERDVKDAAVLQAVRRGVEAIVEHYPWAAGRLHVVTQPHLSADGKEGEEECLQVRINEDGGPGVQLVGARVNSRLQSLGDLSDANPAFEPLLANVDETAPCHLRPLVALQVSIFECGGFCVSMISNHVLFDGVAASIFLQNLASCARGRSLVLPLDLAPRETRIYPHNPPAPTVKCSLNYVHKDDLEAFTTKHALVSRQLIPRRFVYAQHDIAALRSRALSKQEDCRRGFQVCSRVQVLTAHLWRAKARCMIALHEDPLQESHLLIGVNVRGRVVPNIPKNYVGNAVGVVDACVTLKELSEKSLAFVVERIQDAIQQMTSQCFQSDVDHLEILGSNARVTLSYVAIPSLANLGFYDIDFGWGKPTHFLRHFKQGCNIIKIIEGNAERNSFNVYATLISEDELHIFQSALEWELAH